MARNSGMPKDARPRVSTPRLPSEQERAVARNYEARTNPFIPRRTGATRPMDMTLGDMLESVSLMDRSSVINPQAGLGGLSPAEAAKARAYSDLYDGDWDEYYDGDQTGYGYRNKATRAYTGSTKADEATKWFKGQKSGVPTREPAEISIIPTATTDPDRPRTVAAGYDEDRKVLTVVFRDGTFYNYYTVTPGEWREFAAAFSKGPYIKKFLDGKPRGTANMTGTTLASREGLYRIARTGQWIREGRVSGQFNRRSE